MDLLSVPEDVRHKLGDAGSDGLVTMFAEAHRLSTESFERRVSGVEARIDRRFDDIDRRFERVDHRFERIDQRFTALEDQMKRGFADVDRKFDFFGERFERRLAEQRFDLLKWSFLFWISQLAASIAILSAVISR
jgi:hypothetical protein